MAHGIHGPLPTFCCKNGEIGGAPAPRFLPSSCVDFYFVASSPGTFHVLKLVRGPGKTPTIADSCHLLHAQRWHRFGWTFSAVLRSQILQGRCLPPFGTQMLTIWSLTLEGHKPSLHPLARPIGAGGTWREFRSHWTTYCGIASTLTIRYPRIGTSDCPMQVPARIEDPILGLPRLWRPVATSSQTRDLRLKT